MRTLARQKGFKNYRIEDGNLIFTDKEGKDQVPISMAGSVKDVGSELAGALGLNAEKFRTRTKTDSAVSDLSTYKPYEVPTTIPQFNTQENITALITAVEGVPTESENGQPYSSIQRQAMQAKRLELNLRALVGEYMTDEVVVIPIVTDRGIKDYVVKIGGEEVGKMSKPEDVLRALDSRKNKPNAPKKTIAQIMAENPGITRQEAIAIFNAQ